MNTSKSIIFSSKLFISLLVSLLFSLLLAACGSEVNFSLSGLDVSGQAGGLAPAVKEHYAGWAMVAYPDQTYEQMLADLKRMKTAGANVIWISHANPARSFKEEREVGLNPAVFDAFRDPAQISYLDAIAIVKAQQRMLEACREVGLKAVLSVGYHTQMGLEWSKNHPQDLRRTAAGKLWRASGETDPYGSVYSPAFQKDLKAYYDWILFEFANPFNDVIMMLNLADEPLGGDYSSWADKAFQERTGYSFQQVGIDQGRQIELGRFQAGIVADFMKLAAGYWQQLKPGLAVTMSFDGGAMRDEHGLPNLEMLFQEAPANFVLTWDMYPRDRGSLNVAVNDTDITRLIFLVRSIAGYSARYGRKVWLWSAANSWGLGQNVSDNGTVSDAQANLLYLAQLMNSSGGELEGLAVWNYNVKTQGLFNYSTREVIQKASWNEDEMFDRVSALFETVRRQMTQPPGRPRLILLRAYEQQYQQIGAIKADYSVPVVDFARLDALARNNIATVETGHWPAVLPDQWSQIKVAVVLAPAGYLNVNDFSGLRKWVMEGGTLLAPLGVAQVISDEQLAAWGSLPEKTPLGKGFIYSSRLPAGNLFDSASVLTFGPLWRDLLGIVEPQSGYVIGTGSTFMHYYLSKDSIKVGIPAEWQENEVIKYSTDGSHKPEPGGPAVQSSLKRSEFIWVQK